MPMTDRAVNVMIDLETLGTTPGATILSIGACAFFSYGVKEEFYAKIDRATCKRVGFNEEYATLAWWDKQTPEARQEAFSGTEDIEEVLGKFADWLRGLSKDIYVWGNGADFDIALLAYAFESCGISIPWGYLNARCFRTLKNLYYEVRTPAFQGEKHTALADAKHQALHAEAILKEHFDRKPKKPSQDCVRA